MTDTILECGHSPSEHSSFTTGYGTDPETGKRYCYACCADQDREDMLETGRATLYLSQENSGVLRLEGGRGHGTVSNWPGSLKFPAYIKRGRHNIAGTRYDVWFKGPDGKTWHGVQYGDNTQICHCRRTKQEF